MWRPDEVEEGPRARLSPLSLAPGARGALRDPIVIHLYRCVDYIAELLVLTLFACACLSIHSKYSLPFRVRFASACGLTLPLPVRGPTPRSESSELFLLNLYFRDPSPKKLNTKSEGRPLLFVFLNP